MAEFYTTSLCAPATACRRHCYEFKRLATSVLVRALQCAHFTRICERIFRRANEKNQTGAHVRVTSPQQTILCVHTKREGMKRFHTKQRFHLQRDTFARHGRARSRGFQVDLQHATFARVEIFKLCRDIRVMTANQRSTAWPLSDVRDVTANQFQPANRSLQCSPG